MRLSIMVIAAMVMNVSSAYSSQHSTGNGHWQEEMFTAVTEFGGKVSVQDVIWQWSPRSILINTGNSNAGKLKYTNTGVVYEGSRNQVYIVLEGRTSALVKRPRPGIKPVIRFPETDSVRLPVKGEFDNGEVRYGEMTFKVMQTPVYQDKTMSSGWVAHPELSREEVEIIRSTMASVPGYSYTNTQDISRSADSSMFNYHFNELSGNDIVDFAGGWLATIKDIRVFIPGESDKLNCWKGVLSPVVFYF
ncbi:hypothetical protein G3142_005247 [Salmonella enterica subsp. enterica serovar Montevideo]|nr:hypothetical protein [Salmonella enterica subsp. enterica serovar Montevideo]EEK7814152.1 hypothetical protein [Salmonella enterica subsp. enterica serovar Montevideo]